MSLRAVLFDFSGTLFHLEPGAAWTDGVPQTLTPAEQQSFVSELTRPVGVPPLLPAALHDTWERRDLDPDAHREVYAAIMLAGGLAEPDLLYDRLFTASSWRPYPDT